MPSNWNADQQRPTDDYNKKDNFRLLKSINYHVKKLQEAYEQLASSILVEVVTPDDVKAEYDQLIGKQKSVVIQSRVKDFIDHYTQQSSKESELTKAKYRLLSRRISEFEAQYQLTLTWENFDHNKYEALIEWLRLKSDLSNNSLLQIEKLLTKFRNLARAKGLLKNDLNWVRLHAYKHQDHLYLTWEQIRHITDYNPESESLKNAKKLILILAYTGIRVGDLGSFLDNYYTAIPCPAAEFRLAKSPNPSVTIPALEPLRKELKAGMPKEISVSRLNHLTKMLISKAIGREIGRQVSPHTFRRSFITNMLLIGIPEQVLSRITGHSIGGARKIFHSYNKLDNRENAIVFLKRLALVPSEEVSGIKLTRFVNAVIES